MAQIVCKEEVIWDIDSLWAWSAVTTAAAEVFAQVIDGMDVVKEIAGVKTDADDRPKETVRILLIYNVLKAEMHMKTI